jgi:hypothetical protein
MSNFPFFPKPDTDEMFYSVLSRYIAASGFPEALYLRAIYEQPAERGQKTKKKKAKTVKPSDGQLSKTVKQDDNARKE